MVLSESDTKSLLANIARLGGKAMKEDDIVFEGNKLVLPTRFQADLKKAVSFIQSKMKEEEEEAVFSRTYNYRPWDGAYCAFMAMKKAFGMVQGHATYSFWEGKQPPRYITVPTGISSSEEIPWGEFSIPLLDNTKFSFGATNSKDYGTIFNFVVSSPRKNRFIIEGLFKLVAEELPVSSIYKGKAVDGQEQPQYLDLRGVDPAQVIYSEQVQADLDTHVWSVIRHTETHRTLGLPLKRAILLFGPYGTGKTLAGFLTAVQAEANGWTFIMARPGRDDFLQVMQTARLYQPAVVFFEDAENVTGMVKEDDTITRVLDAFDGVQAKGTSLMVVLTTNHPELIHKGMHRPGRVDAQIEIGELDAAGIEKLVRAAIPVNLLDPATDFEPIVLAMAGYVPAFVREAADRSLRYALSRNDGVIEGVTISTVDIVHAANGLRPQFNRMMDASEDSIREQSLRQMINDATKESIGELAADSGTARPDVWNPDALTKLQTN